MPRILATRILELGTGVGEGAAWLVLADTWLGEFTHLEQALGLVARAVSS